MNSDWKWTINLIQYFYNMYFIWLLRSLYGEYLQYKLTTLLGHAWLCSLGCTRSRTGVWCQHIGCCTVPSLLHPNIRIISKNNYDVPMVFIDPGTDDNFSLSIFVFYLHSKNVFLSNLTSKLRQCLICQMHFPNFLKIHSAANYISLIMQFIVYCFYKYSLPSFVNLSNV